MSGSTTETVVQQKSTVHSSDNNDKGIIKQQKFSNESSSNFGTDWLKNNRITSFFKFVRLQQRQPKLEKSDLFYIPAERMTTKDLMENGGRATVTVNDNEIVLVAHKNEVYAIEPKCPHRGRPLNHADIEDVPGCGPCIRCPSHSWKFSLTTGECVIPRGQPSCYNLKIFPVRRDSPKSEIKIGFAEISTKASSLSEEIL